MTIAVREFESMGSFIEALAAELSLEFKRPGALPHAVMLSGGRTPLPVFDLLSARPFPVSKSLHILYSDERHVPAQSPESNYGASLKMLRTLSIPAPHVLRVETEFPLDESAARYDAAIGRFFGSGGQIRLGLLGVGPDGHTCSLFSQVDLDRGHGKSAIAVRRESGPHRVSVTPAVLARVDRVIIAAAGPDKEQVVSDLLQRPSMVTAGKAIALCKHVELWRV